MAKLRRHIKEVHRPKHDYFSCSECAWASLRRSDVQRHCSSARHGAVHSVHTEEGFDALQKCSECCFIGINLNRHQCGERLHRFKGTVLGASQRGNIEAGAAADQNTDRGVPSCATPSDNGVTTASAASNTDSGVPFSANSTDYDVLTLSDASDESCVELVRPDDPDIVRITPVSAAHSASATTTSSNCDEFATLPPLPEDLLNLSVEGFDETKLPRVTVQFDVADLEDGSVSLVMSDYDYDLMCDVPDFVLL